MRASGFADPIGAEDLLAIPAALIEKEMAEFGKFTSGNAEAAAAVAGSAVDGESAFFTEISPIPVVGIHADGVGKFLFEDLFDGEVVGVMFVGSIGEDAGEFVLGVVVVSKCRRAITRISGGHGGEMFEGDVGVVAGAIGVDGSIKLNCSFVDE